MLYLQSMDSLLSYSLGNLPINPIPSIKPMLKTCGKSLQLGAIKGFTAILN